MNTAMIFLSFTACTRRHIVGVHTLTSFQNGDKHVEVGITFEVSKLILRRAKKYEARALSTICRKAVGILLDNVVVPPDDFQYFMECINAAVTHELDGLTPRDRRDSFLPNRTVKLNPRGIQWEELVFA